MTRNVPARFLVSFCLLFFSWGCEHFEGVDTSLPAAVEKEQVLDALRMKVQAQARTFVFSFRFAQAVEPPLEVQIPFPQGLFRGFTDSQVKALFGVTGFFTETDFTGAPLLINSNTEATISTAPGANFQFQNNTLKVTPSGVPAGQNIPPGLYIVDFLPGVFNLVPGIHNLPVEITFNPSQLTIHKLLLLQAQVIPHMAMGRAAGLEVVSTLEINNPNGRDITVQAAFFDQKGAPLPIDLGSIQVTQIDFNIPPDRTFSRPLVPVDPSTLKVGWIRLISVEGRPFSSAIVFSNFNAGNGQLSREALQPAGAFRTSAGIAASEVSTHHVVSLRRDEQGFDTAVAIANPSAFPADLKLKWVESDGRVVATNDLQLEAGHQVARFFGEFFSGQPASAAQTTVDATLQIVSDTDVAVMALRTFRGEQVASLPSGVPGF